jgi:hypothetical protein
MRRFLHDSERSANKLPQGNPEPQQNLKNVCNPLFKVNKHSSSCLTPSKYQSFKSGLFRPVDSYKLTPKIKITRKCKGIEELIKYTKLQ